MPTIMEVMQSTAPNYRATHYQFNQKMYSGFGDGVCHALCKVWLKRGKAEVINFVGTQQNRIINKQTKSDQGRKANQKLVYDEDESVYLQKLKILKTDNEFWEKCANAIAPDLKPNSMKIISLDTRAKYGHAIASCCGTDNHYWFFDPNGGFMKFGTDQAGWLDLYKWIENELKTATTDGYDQLNEVVVHRFLPKGGVLQTWGLG